MEKTTRNRIGCLGLIFVPIILVFVIAIANRPSPEQRAANDARTEQYSAAFACQDAVRGILKAPATAEFQAPRNAQYTYREIDGSFSVTFYVDAQNSFGAKLRETYACHVVKAGAGYRVLDLKPMDGR